MIDPGMPLEIINGNGMLLDGFFLALIGMYLAEETRRRKLRARDWLFRLPVSMHFAVAVAVFDVHVFGKDLLVWQWRRYGHAGAFSHVQIVALVLLGLLGVVGALCKIRAISRPDYGDGPWLLALLVAAAFTAASLLIR